MTGDKTEKKQKLQIFRAAEAPELMETGIMSLEPSTEVQSAGMAALVESGYIEGADTRVLINLPGFSLVKAWFKKGYPLALHSHDSDCLYYVVAGSLQLGRETLGPGDGFFIEANVPYTYTPGPEGVEVLEFRHATHFDFVNHAGSASFYSRAAQTIADNLDDWRRAKPPSER
jgi:quercetin dioxygenase-like cupin family protein